MSNCRDFEIQSACFIPNDNSKPVSINHTTVYDVSGSPIATYFSDRQGFVIDETNYLGGGVAKLGDCKHSDMHCEESQEYTYGIDNTGTRFNEVATFQMTLSDGSTLDWSQDGSDGNWSSQLTTWAAAIQQAANDAGLLWIVEPRFIDNTNPTNLDGTSPGPGGTPSGLPGAPSEKIAQVLFDGGMQWRYVNIQIAPGQPVPDQAVRLTSNTYDPPELNLTAAGPVLGPINKFFVCRSCGNDPVWYLEDGITRAEQGQIPSFYQPCGTLSLIDTPPKPGCSFVSETGCDNGSATPDSPIIRTTSFCPDQDPSISYYVQDSSDPSVLNDYVLIGEFTDCDTGDTVEEPTSPETPIYNTITFGQVCANVGGENVFVTPVVAIDRSSLVAELPVYFDRMGNLIELPVNVADPCDCDCSCPDD